MTNHILKEITLKGFKDNGGCVFCGNKSNIEGKAVYVNFNSITKEEKFECQKCKRFWKIKEKTIITQIKELSKDTNLESKAKKS